MLQQHAEYKYTLAVRTMTRYYVLAEEPGGLMCAVLGVSLGSQPVPTGQAKAAPGQQSHGVKSKTLKGRQIPKKQHAETWL